jgi:hypothetical protein
VELLGTDASHGGDCDSGKKPYSKDLAETSPSWAGTNRGGESGVGIKIEPWPPENRDASPRRSPSLSPSDGLFSGSFVWFLPSTRPFCFPSFLVGEITERTERRVIVRDRERR